MSNEKSAKQFVKNCKEYLGKRSLRDEPANFDKLVEAYINLNDLNISPGGLVDEMCQVIVGHHLSKGSFRQKGSLKPIRMDIIIVKLFKKDMSKEI